MGKSGQRISAREKRPVDYNRIIQGTGELSASMDYGEFSGTNSKALQKKVSTSSTSQVNPKDIRQRCEHVFQLLRCHPSIHLFVEPLDPNHPKFNEVVKDFINLHMIELNFRSGKYTSTFHLGLDIRKMWATAYKLYIDDPEKYQKTQDINQYFEKIFADLDNKPLTTQVYPAPGAEIV